MKLYLLRAINVVDWDSNEAFVICAKSQKAARKIANNLMGNEKLDSKDFWLDENFSSCEILKVSDEEKIILRSFRNG